MFEAMTNPEVMREMSRSSDRALANIQSMPGGYNALMRHMSSVGDPLMDALTNRNTSGEDSTVVIPEDSREPVTEELPNPWAPRSQTARGNTNPAAASGPAANAPRSGVGAMGSGGLGGGFDPFGMGGLGGLGAFGGLGGLGGTAGSTRGGLSSNNNAFDPLAGLSSLFQNMSMSTGAPSAATTPTAANANATTFSNSNNNDSNNSSNTAAAPTGNSGPSTPGALYIHTHMHMFYPAAPPPPHAHASLHSSIRRQQYCICQAYRFASLARNWTPCIHTSSSYGLKWIGLSMAAACCCCCSCS